MKVSQRGIEQIIAHEGERLVAYFDIAGVPTISVGVTDGVTADDVHNKRTISKSESAAMFSVALTTREQAVERLCTVKPTQNQFDALVSLLYNIGEGGFAKSSVLKAHNRGDFPAAAAAFSLWNKTTINGVLQVSNGLTARRAREAELYLHGSDESMPDAPLEITEPSTSFFAMLIDLLVKLFTRKKP